MCQIIAMGWSLLDIVWLFWPFGQKLELKVYFYQTLYRLRKNVCNNKYKWHVRSWYFIISPKIHLESICKVGYLCFWILWKRIQNHDTFFIKHNGIKVGCSPIPHNLSSHSTDIDTHIHTYTHIRARARNQEFSQGVHKEFRSSS